MTRNRKTHKDHEAEITWALSAYTDAVRAERDAKHARERADVALHDKLAALLADYRDSTEARP